MGGMYFFVDIQEKIEVFYKIKGKIIESGNIYMCIF